MVINTNVSAQTGARLLGESSALLSRSLARLSSGSRITSPEDDAAGMAVSLRFDAQINRISAANNNISNAISFSQTQDGFLKKVSKALDRMSELSVLSQDVTKVDGDRDLYDAEFKTLQAYIEDVSAKSFNGVSLFGGGALGVTKDEDGNKYTMTAVDLTTGAVNTASSTGDIKTTAAAATAVTNVKAAITQLAKDRANVGANISRLTYTSEQLGILKDNLTAASSRIKDVDVANESTQFARYNILVQAGTAMLAQANANPQSALRLLS
jgi:flagellin